TGAAWRGSMVGAATESAAKGDVAVLSRRRAAALFAAGMGAIVIPWVLYSVTHGGNFRFGFQHNIAIEVFARSKGLGLDYYEEHLESQFRTPWDVFRRDPGAVTLYLLSSLGRHIWQDFGQLLGWP